MLPMEFMSWWYGVGYKRLVIGVGQRIRRLALLFSLPLLIQTLGAPWRRIITYGGGSLSDRARALLDNLVSRCVGFSVRCIVILVAVISIVATAIVGGLCMLIWPLAPLLAIGLVIRGFIP